MARLLFYGLMVAGIWFFLWENGFTTRLLSHDLAVGIYGGGPRAPARVATLVTFAEPPANAVLTGQTNFLDRSQCARLMKRLTELGARLIVLSALFADDDPGGDQVLGEAMHQAGNVVVAELLVPGGPPGRLEWHPAPISVAFRRAAKAVGFINLDLSKAPIASLMDLELRDGADIHRQIAYETLIQWMGDATLHRFDTGVLLMDPGGDQPLLVPTDSKGRAWLDPCHAPAIPRISSNQVLKGELSDAQLRPLVEDRVVFIGVDYRGYGELPYSGLHFTGTTRLEDPCWYQAAFFESALSGKLLKESATLLSPFVLVWLLLLVRALLILPFARRAIITLLLLLALVVLMLLMHPLGFTFNGIGLGAGMVLLFVARHVEGHLTERFSAARLERDLDAETARLKDLVTRARSPVASSAEAGRKVEIDPALLARALPTRFRDFRLIGAGGMGFVYRVHDDEMKQDVALKVLSPDLRHRAKAVERFLHEPYILQELAHPGLVEVFDGAEGALPWFSMELVEGRSIEDTVRESGVMDPLRAALIAREIAESLLMFHEEELVHRGVRSTNVYVRKDDSLRLLDMGSKREERTALTGIGEVAGSIAHLAPEQMMGGGVVPATDVYGVALLLCKMLGGREPPQSGVYHQSARPILAGVGTPEPLIALIETCLARDPARRPQDAHELSEALDEVLAQLDG